MELRGLWLAALLLPLGGCYQGATGPVYGEAQSAYPPGVYPPGVYPPTGDPTPVYSPPGDPPPGYSSGGYAPVPYAASPSYGYNDGAPTIVEGGGVAPLVLYGAGSGYHEREHQLHHGPEGFEHDRDEHWRAEHRDDEDRFQREDRRSPPGNGRFGAAAFRPGEPPHQGTPTNIAQRPVQASPPRPEAHRAACPPGQRC